MLAEGTDSRDSGCRLRLGRDNTGQLGCRELAGRDCTGVGLSENMTEVVSNSSPWACPGRLHKRHGVGSSRTGLEGCDRGAGREDGWDNRVVVKAG